MELTKKYTLVGINFSSLDGSNSIPVTEAVTGNFSDGDELQVQNGTGGYTVLQWRDGVWCGYGTTKPASLKVERGRGVWLVSHGGASIENPVIAQIKGGVNLSDTLVTTFGESYVITATGLPIDAPVNSELFRWDNLNDKDQLQLPRENGSYTVLEWNTSDQKWHPYGKPTEDVSLSIPKESAVWVVSSNPNATVTITPATL